MNLPPSRSNRRILRRLGLIVGLVLPLLALPSFATDVTAVSSRVYHGYARTKLADGSFKPETFAWGEGGLQAAAIAGDSIDTLSFREIARLLAPALKSRGYHAAVDPAQTDLLILAFWGRTLGPASTRSSSLAMQQLQDVGAAIAAQGGSAGELAGDLEAAATMLAMENQLRDRTNWKNAEIVGFTPEYEFAREMNFLSFAQDLIEEIEADRYFVVLKAYDFRTAWKEKRRKLLWETRFSIRAHKNVFAERLDDMARSAAPYFGHASDRLIRRPIPDGKVDLGETKTIRVEP